MLNFMRPVYLLIGACLFIATPTFAQVCARVVVQIEQELTLEREGFEARLGITNGQPTALEDFSVVLRFTDSLGQPVRVSTDVAPDEQGKFYYRLQSGYAQVNTVAAGGTSKMAYLIVPTIGAAGLTAEGTLYYVGATVKYKVNGVEEVVEVAPDYIRVRPMPSLQLQYFLPGDVYGDDPMTPATKEPVVPFPLGVRVINHSALATARRLKIQSGQPEIIDNQQGLLVDFRIISCEVNNTPAAPSLLVDFGDLPPLRSMHGSWQMTATLSGRFTKFTAEVTHAPELGGALTSLIPADAISAHRLIGKVLVDLPGRDTVRDFLAVDNMLGDFSSVKLYESDTDAVSVLVNLVTTSTGAVITPEGDGHRVTISSSSGMFLLTSPSPIAQDKIVKAVRSDGKVLPAGNSWIAKKKNEQLEWIYTLNLFDTDWVTGQTYTLSYSDPQQDNLPPILTVWGGRIRRTMPGSPMLINVSAVDPDGVIPILETGELPDGASFIDARNGQGRLAWTPLNTQKGSYVVQFRASDGLASDTKTARLEIVESLGAGYADWQKRYWPDSTDSGVIGPDADPDGDQMANLVEYALDGDPTIADDSVLPEIGTITEGGGTYLTLTYVKRTDDSALVCEVVASESLFTPIANWIVQSQTIAVSQDGIAAGMLRERIRDSVPLAGKQRYLRLRVNHPNLP
jgi:hypothetical protein